MDHVFPLPAFVRRSAVCLLFVATLPALHATAQTAAKAGPPQANPAPVAPSAVQDGALAKIQHLINSGHSAEALTQLDEFAKAGSAPPGIDRARGSALYSLDRLPEADAAFARALTADPKDREAAQMKGLTLFRLGRPADAIPFLERAPGWGAQTKADPSYVLALCYMDTRRYDDARHAFAAQYGFPADSAAAYLLAARMLLRREYLPIAQTFARRALELDAQIPLAHGLLGEIALAGNHLDEAIAEFDQERLRDPLEGSTYERLGDAYGRAGRYSDSQRLLQQALLLEPYSTGPYILLGKAMLKQGDPVGAMTYLQKARAMDPANYMTHNLLAQAYRALGRGAEARQELELTEKIQAADTPRLSTPQ